jgi:transposase
MQRTVTPELRQAARRELVRQMEQGVSAREARMNSAVPMHRTTVYRLLKRVQNEGERALTDGRHGHPVKLRGEVLALMREHCQANSCVSSPAIQHRLAERFGVCVSVSQLNRVRASLGLTRKPVSREKKSPKASRLSQDTARVQEACCCWPQ